MPLHNPIRPCNSMLNVILSMDTKGVFHIYKLLMGRNSSITENACYKWNEKLTSQIEVFLFKKSFSRIKMFDDVYLRYIQFRTLRRCFFTNNILFKMNQKTSNLCDFCQIEEDSNEHMLMHCEVVKKIWRNIERWVSQIGVIEYVVAEDTIVLGEFKKSHWLNAIILITKKKGFLMLKSTWLFQIYCVLKMV